MEEIDGGGGLLRAAQEGFWGEQRTGARKRKLHGPDSSLQTQSMQWSLLGSQHLVIGKEGGDVGDLEYLHQMQPHLTIHFTVSNTDDSISHLLAWVLSLP